MVDRKRPEEDEQDRPDEEAEDSGVQSDESGDDASSDDDSDDASDDGSDDASDDDSDDDEDSDDDSDDAVLTDAAGEQRATAIGRSLGVVEEPANAEDEKESAEPAKNRAARRRQRALGRRGGRGARRAPDEAEAGADGGAERAETKESSPRERERDRNKRLRDDLLARRRKAAKPAADAALPVQGLAASEVAEDVLARSGAAVIKWLRRHAALAGWGLLGLVAVTAAVLFYLYRSQAATATASDELALAVLTDQAIVLPPEEDSRTDEQKAADSRQFFPSVEEREKAALGGYERVVSEHGGTGAAILARLGKAGVLLDQREWDGAIEAYGAVLASALAPVDDDVRARALEGQAFAKEGKGDADGALADLTQLEAIGGFKALALYHQARLLFEVKKQNDEAKKRLVEARDILEKAAIAARTSGAEAPSRWLSRVTDDLLRSIDPSALPQKPASPGANFSPEQLQRLLGQQQGMGAPALPVPGGRSQ